MTGLLYRCIGYLSGRLGMWIFHIYAGTVAAGFFLLFPARVAVSVRFYRKLYPARGSFFHICCAWRQYQHFTTVFLDRLILERRGKLSYTSEGREYLERALAEKTGGIILMSHMGNWEVAAHLLRQKNMPLLLYMGIKDKEEIEKIQKKSLDRSGVRIIALTEDADASFELLEAIRFLRNGGMVSLTGDMIRHESQRTVPVRFLGHETRLPEVPHLLALLSGAPVFIFFAFRTGPAAYRFSLQPPLYVRAVSRAERKQAVIRSAQHYADLLEKAVREHPQEWYHFQSFFPPESS